ncbi:MAG: 50S ribosomal protein L18Ae [Candidatus Bathyarchaeia archaeon]|jgi:large subunit ribosomal protein LX|nr:50S ribosomal protein L18a [Candidatus Bathyarchaeota archaeon A05DMB-4]MDH7595358.1 50S ribosomal protein L18Ae [Candidatus Bathyarchaeota archaeon]
MSEVKIFRVSGRIAKPNWKTNFEKELRAVKPEDAVETVYKEMGSKHRAKRFEIKIDSVVEIKPEEIKDPVLKKFAMRET